MSTIKVGDNIPLSLNLFDKAADKNVRVDIYSSNGEKLKQVYLYHIESGLYVNTDVPMPDVRYIIAFYEVENSEDYETVSERFYSSPLPLEPKKWITGIVDEVSESETEWITGVVE